MSYVDLKHLLSALALEAVRDPSGATWVHPLAAYAAAATPLEPAVTLRQSTGIGRLVEVGLLERGHGRISCRSTFVPHLVYLKRQTARLATAVDSLASSAVPTGVPQDLALGAALFNAGLYFETHELLELTWRATTGPERDFYHGIVQSAAAFYHLEKQNLHGARTLLAKALRRLAPYTSPYLRIHLAGFRNELAKWQDYLTAPPGGPTHRPSKPALRFSRHRTRTGRV